MRLPSFVSRQQKADGDIGGVDGLFFVSVCQSPHLRPNYSYSTVSVREKQVTCQIKAQDIRPACVLTPLLIFRYTMFWNLCFFLAPLWHFHSFEVFFGEVTSLTNYSACYCRNKYKLCSEIKKRIIDISFVSVGKAHIQISVNISTVTTVDVHIKHDHSFKYWGQYVYKPNTKD